MRRMERSHYFNGHTSALRRASSVAFFVLFCVVRGAAQATELAQRSLAKWHIPPADYSGITSLGGERYAVISDKGAHDGFYVWRIRQGADGQVERVESEGFSAAGDAIGNRDTEGIAYVPATNTLFISGEADQRVLEYDFMGTLTGRELQVPPGFSIDSIVPNAGFESLCYDTLRHRFWTMTESTLPRDGKATSNCDRRPVNVLRMQAYGDDLRPREQYLYRMDASEIEEAGRLYVMGVSALCAWPDGRLFVLEREANVPVGYWGAECRVKVYAVRPAAMADGFLDKTLVHAFSTRLSPFRLAFANYEGMCPGAFTADGRLTLLLVSDSQSGAGKGPFRLKDYIKVLIPN